jgi:MFS family permease
MRTKNKTLLKAAILAVGVQDIGGGAASPALADIIKAMPAVSTTRVMMIASFPQFTQIFPALFFGKLASIFNRKTLFTIGCILFLVGGFGPFWLDDINPILLCRGILGLGVGIFVPLAITLVSDFFEDPAERNTMLGLNVAAANIGGMFFQSLGGFLAKINWRYCFVAYLFCVVVFLFVFLFIPEPEKKTKVEGPKAKVPGIVWGFCILYLFANMFMMAVVTNNAIAIDANGFGDAASSGIALTLFTAGTFSMGLVFGRLVKIVRIYALPFGYFLGILGFLLCFFAQNITMMFLGCFFVGLAAGVFIPETLSRITAASPAGAIATGIGMSAALQGVGTFFQPIAFNPLLEVLGQAPGKPAFALSAIGYAILILIVAVPILRAPRQS